MIMVWLYLNIHTLTLIECKNSTCISVCTYYSCSVPLSVLSVSKGKECSHDSMNTHSSKQSLCLYLIKHQPLINIVRLPELLFKNRWKKHVFESERGPITDSCGTPNVALHPMVRTAVSEGLPAWKAVYVFLQWIEHPADLKFQSAINSLTSEHKIRRII